MNKSGYLLILSFFSVTCFSSGEKTFNCSLQLACDGTFPIVIGDATSFKEINALYNHLAAADCFVAAIEKVVNEELSNYPSLDCKNSALHVSWSLSGPGKNFKGKVNYSSAQVFNSKLSNHTTINDIEFTGDQRYKVGFGYQYEPLIKKNTTLDWSRKSALKHIVEKIYTH